MSQKLSSVPGLKVSVRLLRRHPVYSLINVTGLAVGMASFILITMFVREELSFDRFHENADRIARVTSHYSDETGTRSFARTYPAIAPALMADFPEVSEAVRLQRWKAPMKAGERQFNEQEMFMVDPSFFKVFTFPVLQGAKKHLFDDVESAVITRSTARRYFGDADPIGREILMGDDLRLHVTGVVADPPANSHIKFSVLMPLELLRDMWARRGADLDMTWTSGVFYTYVLLQDAGARLDVESKLQEFLDRHMDGSSDAGVEFRLALQPLTEIHLGSDLRQEMGVNGSWDNVVAFLLIALLVLIISCLNFVNLSTARASKRMKEVGVRKAVGAQRSHLVRQFILEAVAMSAWAVVFALFAVHLLIPWFNSLAGSDLSLGAELGFWPIVSVVAFTVAIGLLAGSYPALVLSSFKPSEVLKGAAGDPARVTRLNVRRSLVAFQFFLSIGIMACTALAWQQTTFMRTSDPGFNQHALVLPYYWDSSVTAQFPTLKNELLRLSEVEHVTASGDVPGRMFTSMSYWIEGMPDDERSGINALIVDPDFAETYGLDIVAGKDFSSDQAGGLGASFLLNETAVRELNLTAEEAVGRTLEMNTRGPVIGVVRDFHFEGLQAPVEPLVMTVWPDWFGYITVALNTTDLDRAVSDIGSVWTSTLANRPFEYFFLDQDFEDQYRAEQRFSQVFGALAVLAIVISCLGLLGLAAFTAEQKRKEIGVRKVLGASVGGIVALVNREFALLIVVGGAAAIPLAYLVTNNWLQSFAYRIDLGPMPFILSFAAAAFLGLATVSYHSIRAATANPIESLRYE